MEATTGINSAWIESIVCTESSTDRFESSDDDEFSSSRRSIFSHEPSVSSVTFSFTGDDKSPSFDFRSMFSDLKLPYTITKMLIPNVIRCDESIIVWSL